ncbi:MAG: hypothetical protein R6V47_00560, partial [Candidatus Delongbacteria bacterium]
MKKLAVLLIMSFCTCLFSMEWYSSGEQILDDVRKAPRDSKDTLWYAYYAEAAYIYEIPAERAVYVNVNDFGLEYPIQLNAIDAFFYEPGFDYIYKVYAKDGTTVLWEMAAPDTSSHDYYNIHEFQDAMIMTDDFWIAAVPQPDGKPPLISSDNTDSQQSYYLDA